VLVDLDELYYAIQVEQAKRDVAVLYELQDKVLPQDRDLFCASLEIHQLQSLSQLRGWLAVNKDLILFSVRTAASNSRAHTPRLTRYFPKCVATKLARPSRARPPDAARQFYPSRLTQFFPTAVTKNPSHLPRAPAPLTNSPSVFARPRQRYLFDFFPNHPG
jgi:hypothetical protein